MSRPDREGLVQQIERRQSLEHQDGCLLVSDEIRQFHQSVRRCIALGGIGAKVEIIGDAVARMKAGDAGPHSDNLAGAFMTNDERQRRSLVETGPKIAVDEVQTDGMIANPHLAGTRLGKLDILVRQHLRPAELVNPYRLGHHVSCPQDSRLSL